MGLSSFVMKHKTLFAPLFRLYYCLKQTVVKKRNVKRIKKGLKSKQKVIYYCGIPMHNNLGDLAQGVCIRKWLKKYYPSYYITEIETNALVNTKHSCLPAFRKAFNPKNDFILFQSGYTTTDLGGFADYMHQEVMKAFSDAKILMMPQTILFKSEERKKICSNVYNNHKNMLFLARDATSFEMAKQMFPDVPKKCFPDIVTSLIGTFNANEKREGIVFCLRNDSEKFYSNPDLELLIEKCKSLGSVFKTDTTKRRIVIKKAEKYVMSEINKYSKFRVMITDRYHGTILSLAANTPVVILKTTDHKVTTGADWFKNVYNDYVFVASDLDDAFAIVKKIYNRKNTDCLDPYFEKEYYSQLPKMFEEAIKDGTHM